MKAKASLSLAVLSVLLVLALAVGCTRAPNDAQIANQVQSKIATDGNVQNKQIGVQSASGVVTLTGSVGSEMERAAAANDAAQIPGVKTVVNNLQVAPPEVAQAAPPPEAEQPAPEPQRRPSAAARRARPAASQRRFDYSQSAPAPAAPARMAEAPVASTPAPPAIRTVTIPEGTPLWIRLVDPIDSERNQVGDSFHATLSQPVMIGDEVVIPTDADVVGRVVDVKSAGHFSGQSAIALELATLSMNGKTYQLRTNQYAKQGSSRGKNTAAKVGGGAALGAIIGGIAGGGKGAAIGATVGAGAGGGVQAATKGQQIKLPSEAVLNFQLTAPLNVVPSAGNRTGRGMPVDQ